MLTRFLITLLLSPTLAWAAFVSPITIMKDHRDYDLKANAGYTQTVEWMIRIDTQQGVDQYGQAKLQFDGKRGSQTVLEAFTIKPNGEKVSVSPDRIKVRNEAADELTPYFSDDVLTVIIFPQVEVGSKLYYKAVTIQEEPIIKGHFSENIFFTPNRRYENTVITLRHPREMSLHTASRVITGNRKELTDGSIQYEYRFNQDVAIPPEPSRVELIDFAPGVQFTTFSDYAQLASTFQSLMNPKTTVTPKIQSLANELTKDTKSTKQMAQKLYQWVSSNIRYVGIDVGSSGFEPHSADEILENQYGDCKDHVVLMEALLSAVGIKSSPALINMSDSYVLPSLATTEFDHVITYIPEWNLYLDSTAQFAEFGLLPASELGKPTLLAESGTIHETPTSSIKRDFTVTHTKMNLLPTGGIVGVSDYTPHGEFSYVSRSAQFAYEDQDTQTVVDNILRRFQETGTGEMKHSDPNDLSSAWKVTSEFKLDPVINLPGPSALVIPSGLSPSYIRALAKKRPFLNRKYPFVCGSERHMEYSELTFPKNVRVTRVPKGVSHIEGGISFKSTYVLSGNTLSVTREYVEDTKGDYCMPSKIKTQERIRMMEAIKSDLRNQVFVE